MYASAYGNTAALAQAISRGVVKSGVAVDTLNLELASLDDVVKAVKESDGFSIGSPTLGGHMPTPVQVRTEGYMLHPPGLQSRRMLGFMVCVMSFIQELSVQRLEDAYIIVASCASQSAAYGLQVVGLSAPSQHCLHGL
jgi:hypothetical protein